VAPWTKFFKTKDHIHSSRKLREGDSRVNLPDNATRSTTLRPCNLNLVRIVWNVLFGAGILLFEPLKLALLESLLPNGTSQLGPPVCIHKQKDQLWNFG
jgi:hypothetical protein